MQRYRVNLPLLIGLVVGFVVLVGGSYGLYVFQKTRNANRLLERAAVAREAGDLRECATQLVSYVRLVRDDEEAWVRLANTRADIAEDPKSEPKDIRQALGQMETTVRDYPTRDKLRRRLVDLYMSPRIRGLKQALDHVQQLLNRNPGDPELQVMRSECLFAAKDPKALEHAFGLIGFNAGTETFDESKAAAPNDPGVYARVARVMRYDRLEQDLADRIMDRCVEMNPELGEAYLARGQYQLAAGREEEGKADIAEALRLAPNEPGIVIAAARIAASEERFEDGFAMLRKSVEENPTTGALYLTMADLAARQQDAEKAIAFCDEGIAAVAEEQSALLLFQKARLQLQSEDPLTARDTIAKLREGELIPSAYPDYLEARLAMNEGRWFEAAEAFEETRAFITSRVAGTGVELNILLGICRERLGQNEVALESYNAALGIDPGNEVAQTGRERMMRLIGGGQRKDSVAIYTLLAQELAKPEAEQDWDAFDQAAVEYIDAMRMGDAMLGILRGEVLMRRGKYKEARKKLVEAYELDPNNLGVRRAAVKLFAADPDQGPVKALRLLDKVVKDFGDMPILRLERADLLSLINDEGLVDQLLELGEDIDDWTNEQKAQLWKGLGEKLGALGEADARREALVRVAELSASDLPTLLQLFSLAQEADDDEAMDDAQQRILKVVGSKDDPTYLFTQARRELSAYLRQGRQGDSLREASNLVERALAQRDGWNELHRLKAEIALANNDAQAALASFDRAADLGQPTARSLVQHVKLLMQQGRYADAIEQMESVNRVGREQLLGRDYADALLAVGRVPEALVVAESVGERAQNNANSQLWLGRFYARASGVPDLGEELKARVIEQAGDAFAKTVELAPKSADAWLALVGYYAATKRPIDAEDALRRAQLALPEDQTLLLSARCYAMIGRSLDAEALYRQALDKASDADRPRVARLLAEFYLGPSYRRADRVQKATPLINDILRSVADGDLDVAAPNARWARTEAARVLASSGGYRQLRDAERLLSSNATGGQLPLGDRLLMANILAPRPEPVSRLKAANLLENIGRNQKLSKEAELNLGRLYFSLGEWRKCRQQMIGVIANNPQDPTLRLAYLEMLLQRGGPADLDAAVKQVKRLQEVAPNELGTREMLARVAHKKGKTREASRAVVSLLPRNRDAIGEEQLPLVKRVAARLVEFDDLQRAETLYQIAAAKGGPRERLDLAQFVGEKIDPAQGLELLEEARGNVPPGEAISRGLAILRASDTDRSGIDAEQLQLVDGWLTRAQRENPDAIQLQLQRAELSELQTEYDEAADRYGRLLERDELVGLNRAIVLNNLAYLLALSRTDEASIAEAAEYITEAVEILGPNTDILDTRAVVAMAAGRYEDAVNDLELAIIDRPTATKYFHLALAYAGAERLEDCRDAWESALGLGLTRESTSRRERDQFDRLKEQIEAGRLTAAG